MMNAIELIHAEVPVRPMLTVLLLAAAVVPMSVEAQIEVGANVQVSAARGEMPHGEVLIAADPSDPERLIACSMYFLAEINSWQTVVYRSKDAGRNWTPTLEIGEFFPWSADPACTMAEGGKAYFVSISSERYLADESYLPVFRSDDGGETWIQSAVIPNRHQRLDREYLVVDGTGGRFHGRLYMHGAGLMRDMAGVQHIGDISLLRSLDEGASFLGPVKRGSLDRQYPLGPIAPTNAAILSDGALVIAFGETKGEFTDDGYLRLRDNRNGDSSGSLNVLISRDGGDSFLPAIRVSDWHMKFRSWSTRASASLAADPGSAVFRDRLYLAWADAQTDGVKILLCYSVDGGETWSPPRVVSDDSRSGNDYAPDHFMPLVAVNEQGTVGVMWYDRRDSGDNLGWTVRFAASTDGGETFLPSEQVSARPNAYDVTTMWPVHAVPRPSVGGHYPQLGMDLRLSLFHYDGGHTAGLTADAGGVFHPLWVDNRTGIPQVWTAPVRVTGAAVRNGSTALAAMRDVSTQVELRLSNTRADRTSNQITVDARLENTSDSDIVGPLVARVLEVRSELGNARILGADNLIEDGGAVWEFNANGGVLGAGAQTLPKTLRFRLDEIESGEHGADLKLGLVHIQMRVFAEDTVADREDGNGAEAAHH